jgi:4-amino-4-deoxy-L-arabinose transferase-like glycosyltransferase
VIGVILALRVVGLALDHTDLYVDEAQYWLWGQDLAFGYYSKPPMIGWLLRAVTDLAGSDGAFWVRLPAIALHAITAALLAAITARHIAPRAAPWVAAAYLTLPLVTVGSYMISTDSVMFPFLALALLAWLRLADEGGRRWALIAGLALGGGVMSKYAAIYYLILLLPALVFIPALRVPLRRAALALLGFALAIAPNVAWNIANGLTTLRHTMDNADWVNDPAAKAALNFAGLGEFAGAQFVVFGPAFLATLLWLALRPALSLPSRQRSDPSSGPNSAPNSRQSPPSAPHLTLPLPLRGLVLWLSLPIIALVCVQALLNQAYANWAAAAYVAAPLAVVPWLLLRARWLLIASLVLHGSFAVVVPVAAHFAPSLRLTADAPLLMARWLGREAMSDAITTRAAELPVTAIIADDRDVLADLFYRARGDFPAQDGMTAPSTPAISVSASSLPIWAEPERGRAPNHYVQSFPYPGATDTRVLLITRSKRAPEGCAATSAGVIDPVEGAYAKRTMRLFVVDGSCWDGIAR